MKTATARRERGQVGGEGGGKKEKKEGKWKDRVCRYRLSAFGEFYKIPQEVLETEGTMALTVAVKETPLRDFHEEKKKKK